jgi:signal transduction histidine kinase
MLSWVFLCTLLALCAVLGVLQYRWIGEVSVAARDRLRGSLQASLFRVAYDFDSEIFSAARDLTPNDPGSDSRTVQSRLLESYAAWKHTGNHYRLFQRIALAESVDDRYALRMLDLDRDILVDAAWPAEWSAIEQRLNQFASRRPGMPPPFGEAAAAQGFAFESPLLPAEFRQRRGDPGGPPRPGNPFERRVDWLIVELNPSYVREVLLPEILQRHLGTGGALEYHVEVVTRSQPPAVIYQSDPYLPAGMAIHADASVTLFETRFDFRRGRAGGPRRPESEPGPMGGGLQPGGGRWQMFVRHRAGSLEALVAETRRRNLGVTAGVLLLMAATIGALVRLTRRTQALAAEQMEFVAAVSHELRTPLTVIYTAGYNLQGKMSSNPAQVEKYGALIQRQSGRLREMVEQVLRFGRAESGRVVGELEPLSVEAAIDDAVESSRAMTGNPDCVIEKHVEQDLPAVMGDALALKHAIENLLSNAAKYGSNGTNWIGVSAACVDWKNKPAVEIRVEDRGPGIPADEQKRIFEPFFRGARAIAEQSHGTGLGLSLVKRIVEAHGGTIRVKSAPMHGAEFIVRLPAASAGAPQ